MNPNANLNVTQQIIAAHLLEGEMIAGSDIALKIDQTLTQDATGTMAYLEFEAMGQPRVKTELSVAYIDHNTLQSGFENADDHRYLQTVCSKIGVYVSRPGNGICHQVHLERFGIPGKTLIGSDSHTPTGGGIGMLAFGAGGLDVAVAMGGGAYHIRMPRVIGVELVGALRPYVSAKDVILEILRRKTVKGGVGCVFEYFGPGVASLTVPERATITNMGAELGATTSVFPSDEVTRDFLNRQGRGKSWSELKAGKNAKYDEVLTVDLTDLKPMAACPHSPDNVMTVDEVGKIPVQQVCIGSCTNSSFRDMMRVAYLLRGKTVSPGVSLTVSPGSRQVLQMLALNGALADIIGAGARVLECACGPCIGMGQSPCSGGVSLRTFNRNFEGRSGTADAQVYLVSPEVAAASAVNGYLTDPTTLDGAPVYDEPEQFLINDNMIDAPAPEGEPVKIERGPNIKPIPIGQAPGENVEGRVLIHVEDNITTDHIMPAGAKLLPYRSNVPKLSESCFTRCDPQFPQRAKEFGGGIIVGGENYGQGSSREHAALVPLYLGVKAVLVKSLARIHQANLVNAGIVPMVFANGADYDGIEVGDELCVVGVRSALNGDGKVIVRNLTKGTEFEAKIEAGERQREILLAGGLLNYTRENA